jgi:hypothetical protein
MLVRIAACKHMALLYAFVGAAVAAVGDGCIQRGAIFGLL